LTLKNVVVNSFSFYKGFFFGENGRNYMASYEILGAEKNLRSMFRGAREEVTR